MNTPKFVNYIKQNHKRELKRKFITQRILKESDNYISSGVRVIYSDEKHIYVNCYLTYMHNLIFLSKNKYYVRKHYIINKEILLDKNKKESEIEDKVRHIMKENNSISPKKISELTGFSIYTIYKCYMKIRRENSK